MYQRHAKVTAGLVWYSRPGRSSDQLGSHVFSQPPGTYSSKSTAPPAPSCRHTPGVQLSVVRKKLNLVADGGRRKLSVVTDGATGRRPAVPNFYPYRTCISSHNLPLATVCIKYAVHMLSIYFHLYNYKIPISR